MQPIQGIACIGFLFLDEFEVQKYFWICFGIIMSIRIKGLVWRVAIYSRI